jgi:hypothetical protein
MVTDRQSYLINSNFSNPLSNISCQTSLVKHLSWTLAPCNCQESMFAHRYNRCTLTLCAIRMFSFLLNISLRTLQTVMPASPPPETVQVVNILKRRCEVLEEQLAHSCDPKPKAYIFCCSFTGHFSRNASA